MINETCKLEILIFLHHDDTIYCRFQVNGLNLTSKLAGSVACPLVLSVATERQTELEFFDANAEHTFQLGEIVEYELIASVNHFGASIEKGHYVCHNFNEINGRRVIDDTEVKKILLYYMESTNHS